MVVSLISSSHLPSFHLVSSHLLSSRLVGPSPPRRTVDHSRIGGGIKRWFPLFSPQPQGHYRTLGTSSLSNLYFRLSTDCQPRVRLTVKVTVKRGLGLTVKRGFRLTVKLTVKRGLRLTVKPRVRLTVKLTVKRGCVWVGQTVLFTV